MISKDIGIMEKKNIGANGFFFLNGARRVYQRKTDNTRKSTNNNLLNIHIKLKIE